ncbi:hypothetical protein [Nitrosopumilus sp.]|uniref:hypothetical protein n=1 Tax=Nitrosopumilus sp. TaxID=2024843 RepID=UPI002930BEF3|nr:hypothetical protein [Nitrosopumilus sp.]
MIEEGPNENHEMQSFISQFLSDSYTPVRSSLRDKDPASGRSYSDTQFVWILYKNN